MKTLKIISILALLLILGNCSDTETNDLTLPLDFTISVSNITDNSADLIWTSAVDDTTGDVSYSVYVNNELKLVVSPQVYTLEYTVTGLSPNEEYQVLIVAENTVGQKESTTQFITIIHPNPFELTVTNITSNSALLEWTDSSNGSPDNVLYNVFLDDQLIQSNISSLEFELTNLNYYTNYNAKVVATNNAGELEQLIEFKTGIPNGANVLLKRYGDYVAFEYNENGYLTYVQGFDIGDYNLVESTLEYDSNHNIISSSYNTSNPEILEEHIFASTTNVYNSDNSISSSYISWGDSYGGRSLNYIFSSMNTYDLTYYIQDLGYIETTSYNGVISFDEQNRVIQIDQTDTDTGELETLLVEYLNGNISKVTMPEGDVYEFVYDDYNNFETYTRNFNRYLPEQLHSPWDWRVRRYPYLNNFRNQNNILEIIKNGESFMVFNYEYYEESGYPKSRNGDVLEYYVDF